MPLDDNIKKFLIDLRKNQSPPYSNFTPKDLRQWFNQNYYSKEKPQQIQIDRIDELMIPASNHSLKVRIYYPNHSEVDKLPALMYFHGGGFVIRDDMNTYDHTCRKLCQDINCMIIAVDYRLAPEHPFPAAPDDCYTATCWVAKHADELHIDPKKIAIIGESCGGNLAATIAMMARDNGGPKLCCQIIISPMLEYRFDTNSYIKHGTGEYILSIDTMQWFWNHYLSKEENKNNPYFAPLKSTNLHDLPKALVISAEYDSLCDDGWQYAEKLKSAGINTEYKCFKGLIHGFLELGHISEKCNDAFNTITTWAKTELFK